MEYRQMGNTGVRVSAVGLGTNQFGGKVDQQGVNDIVAAAIDLGTNLIDTADVYQGGRSEETLGVALRGRWNRVVLATKVHGAMGDGPNDHGASRYHIIAGVEASLRRLNTDHIDLYQIHRWDETTPVEEMLRTLDDLITAGKIRSIGASTLPPAARYTISSLRSAADALRDDPEPLSYAEAYRTGNPALLPCPQGGHPAHFRCLGILTASTRGEAAPAGSARIERYVQRYMTDANYTRVERLPRGPRTSHTMAESLTPGFSGTRRSARSSPVPRGPPGRAERKSRGLAPEHGRDG